ncbi:MAG: AAA family ATPase [Anaerolineae bacterium]|nr:AAA family ATPase [Anaerolineae bacterium]
MTTTIAVAGKGGTGKTTVTGLLVRYLVQSNRGTILAIDADPSSNLHYVLGMDLEETIGDIREDMLDQVQTNSALAGSMPGGMSKSDYLDYQIQMAMVEGEALDLLAMGRPEGPGCYCATNQMLRVIMDRIGNNYDYVVMDNEAGMEHISRRTTRDVDHLILVTDLSQRGVIAVKNIIDMVPTLDVNVGHMYLVVNRLMGDQLPPAIASTIANLNIELAGTIANDNVMMEYEFTGRPLIELPEDTQVVKAVYHIAEKIFLTG